MIGVGIVGYGYAGRTFHSYLVRRAPGLELRAIATRDPERRARAAQEQPGVATYATVEELLGDGRIDLVVLATPHDTHCDLATRALAAGKHAVVDKPMAITLAEADRMVEAAEKAGRVLSVFHNRRWDWDFLTVRRVIEQGLIGRPYLFESTVLGYREPRRSWRSAPETMGSLVHDWGAHLVDHALRLVPSPVKRVRCRIVRPRPEPAVGNFARIDLDFADGTLYAIEVGNLARPEKPRWYVLGETGGLVKYGLDPQERAFGATGNPDDAAELPEERARVTTLVAGQPAEVRLESVRGSWTGYYANVSAHLNEGAPLEVTAEQAREVIAVLDAAVRSAATGLMVDG
ncbi:MAG TPA: Gfo/Idh/MocA family oxidoreductase [Chloroflexota bacterium]|jgi:scyllo-inositol 2-dehydrogenase (NADP+)|nr:Gfo/Idh/MocA family oxidoreductase [Chloroflexota bacterium]